MEHVINFLESIRPFLETLYFLASIALVSTIVIGIQQVVLLKKDLQTTNKRAAVEKSIEYLNWFANTYIPRSESFTTAYGQKSNTYKGPINRNFFFDENCKPNSKYIQEHIKLCLDNDGVHLLNQLEFLSAALINGLADEELMFNPTARLFCKHVERLYVLICLLRRDNHQVYSNIIKLYSIWKDRLNKIHLETKKSQIDKDLAEIKDEKIVSIGS